MSWEKLNTPPDRGDKDMMEGLRRACARALADPALEKYLRSVVQAGCYQTGRTFEQVTYAEGQRSLARQILHLGGKLNE